MSTVSVVLALSAALAAQASTRPDFSGAWTLDPARTQTTGAPTRVGSPVPTGGRIQEPRKIKHVAPVYPADAQRTGTCGVVVTEALIDREGRVNDVRVLRSVPGLDEAAVKAISQWRYTPTLVNGQPTEVVMVVTLSFSISGCTPQPGAPVGTDVPRAGGPGMRGAGGGGLGFGGAPAGTFVVKQDADTLNVTRVFGKDERTMTYRFDGRDSVNRLPTAMDANRPFTFVSRWEGQRLITRVTWDGPSGPRERIETLWLEGETLMLQNTRPGPTAASEALVETYVYMRKR
jgi:TonB family protein